MESVVSQPYYSYCSGLLFAAHPPALNDQESAFLRQRAIDIYNLRPRSMEAVSEQEPGPTVNAAIAPSNQKRTRGKPASRSRTTHNKRLLVNARERERMKTLNKGFENLRNALPCYIADGHISKITTLRLAINYIKTLTEVLKDTKNEDYGIEEQSSPMVQHLRTEELLSVYADHSNKLKFEYTSAFVPIVATTTAAPTAPTKVPGAFKQHLASSQFDVSTGSGEFNAEFPAIYKNNLLATGTTKTEH